MPPAIKPPSIIRPAIPGDEAAIHKSHMRSINEVCIKDHSDEVKGWGNRELGSRWFDAVKKGDVWVVEFEGKICGHGYIRIFDEENEKKAHIHGLYLTPEVLSQGNGAKLMRLMLEKARKSGVKKVTLESTITAHNFYKHFGFVDSAPKTSHLINGYPVTAFPMELDLDV